MRRKDKRKQTEFLQVYEPIHENFVRFCQARARGVMNYEDLVSESTLKAYQNWEKINKKDSLKYFLFTTARNLVLNTIRKKQELSLEDVNEDYVSSNNDGEKDMEIEFLYLQLEKLSDVKKEALILFEINGFAIKEIAQIQGISEGAVKVNLSRGRKELQQLMIDTPKIHQETEVLT
ncbi:MAG: RNA polymerase sigma factor [Crocinitomicaceae bacterium]